VFLAGSRQYIEYVENLPKTYNEGDRAFYDAINIDEFAKTNNAKKKPSLPASEFSSR